VGAPNPAVVMIKRANSTNEEGFPRGQPHKTLHEIEPLARDPTGIVAHGPRPLQHHGRTGL